MRPRGRVAGRILLWGVAALYLGVLAARPFAVCANERKEP